MSQQPPEFHPEGDVFVHTLLLLENLPHPCPPTLAWGALLHDVGKPATFRVAPDRIRFDDHVDVGVKIAEEICERLRFSNRRRSPSARPGRQSHALWACHAHEGVDAEEIPAPAAASRNILRCIAPTAWPATAI